MLHMGYLLVVKKISSKIIESGKIEKKNKRDTLGTSEADLNTVLN